MRCDRCSERAVVDQPYASAHLCAQHFRGSVQDRSRREMYRQLPRFRAGTVAVALSGGKDSSVALTLVHRYFARRPTARVIALSVDEGIGGYRPRTLASAAQLATDLGVEHRIVHSRDVLGVTTDEAARELAPVAPCSFCGVWRRQLLNRAAMELGAEVLVLGFNLDDLAQTVLMNLARADLGRLARMAPHRSRQAGLVPRVAPLATIPEREVWLYAHLSGVPFVDAECPHAAAAARNVYREVIWQLEDAIPGTRHALLRTRERLVPLLLPESERGAPGHCLLCGEPASSEYCRACEYLRQLRNPLIGASGSATS